VGARNAEPRRSQEAMMVNNSMMPYIKNDGLYGGTGLPSVDIFGATAVPGAGQPIKINLTFNGLLHAYSATAVAAPSRLPILAPLMMKQNLIGAVITSPALDCQTTVQQCRFTPGGLPSGSPGPFGGSSYGYVWWGVGQSQNFTLWQYGRGMTFVAADTSAKFFTFNAPKWPLYAANVNTSPWSSFDPAGPEGSPYWMTDCVSPGRAKGSEVYYPGFFRPDSEYNWRDSECDYGGG
jgi:hypothetical protein